MLALLAAHESESARQVAERVRYAVDVEDLWYLRQDLMILLSATGGQAHAWPQVAALHPLFEGLLPATLTRLPPRQAHAQNHSGMGSPV